MKGINAAQVGAALRFELDNIRRAWRWAVETAALERLRQSAEGLAAFFVHVGLGFEGAQLLQTAIHSPHIQTEAKTDLLPFLLVKQLTLLNTISSLNDIIAII